MQTCKEPKTTYIRPRSLYDWDWFNLLHLRIGIEGEQVSALSSAQIRNKNQAHEMNRNVKLGSLLSTCIERCGEFVRACAVSIGYFFLYILL